MVEDGHLSVVSQVGRTPRGEGQHRHEPADFAARPPQGFDEPAARRQAADRVEQQADLHALARTFGEELHQAPPRLIAAQDECGDVDAVPGRADMFLQRRKLVLPRRQETHPVPETGGSPPAATTVVATGPQTVLFVDLGMPPGSAGRIWDFSLRMRRSLRPPMSRYRGTPTYGSRTITRSQAKVFAGARFSLIRRATSENARRKPAMAKRWAGNPLSSRCSKAFRKVASMVRSRGFRFWAGRLLRQGRRVAATPGKDEVLPGCPASPTEK